MRFHYAMPLDAMRIRCARMMLLLLHERGKESCCGRPRSKRQVAACAGLFDGADARAMPRGLITFYFHFAATLRRHL